MKREQWGSKWILGGDFNDTRSQQEKNGGRVRNENSCNKFKGFHSEDEYGESGVSRQEIDLGE